MSLIQNSFSVINLSFSVFLVFFVIDTRNHYSVALQPESPDPDVVWFRNAQEEELNGDFMDEGASSASGM